MQIFQQILIYARNSAELELFDEKTINEIIDLAESYVLLIFFNAIVGEFHTYSYKFMLPYFVAELNKENIII